jgi:PEP-CTERM motif
VERTSCFVGRLLLAVAAFLVSAAGPPAAVAGMLYPSAYASLGGQLSEAGYYQVDTNAGVMTLPDGRTITGVFSGGVAVFTFGSVDINGATFAVQGANPIALLSQGGLTLANVQMNLSASGSTPGPGGGLSSVGQGGVGYWSAAGGGGFGGAGGQGGSYVFTGDPRYPPAQWGSTLSGAAGGASYGGLTGPIQGGGAGGDYMPGSPGFAAAGQGGAGGGAIELGANQILGLTGVSIAANGGKGGGNASGGGSGGGISLLGDTVNVDTTSFFSATGGAGGRGLSWGGPGGGMIGAGGDGGGGRIDILGDQVSFLASYDLSGAHGGVVQISSVPEPSSLVLAAIALVAGAAHARSRRVRRHPTPSR